MLRFGGIQLTTTLDYPGRIATILFVKGCNLQCGFCHNVSLVTGSGRTYTEKEIFSKLLSRQHLINNVVISGGEPSFYHSEIIPFIIRLKNSGFDVKVDTNGINPNFVRRLISNVDYIAMDIKTELSVKEYEKVTRTGMSSINIEYIRDSIRIIMNSGIPFEFRTTVVKSYHSIDILTHLAEMKLPNHFLQQFVKSDNIFDSSLEGYTSDELQEIYSKLLVINEDLKLRGI